ncbi:MAG: ribosome maturation factor RimP [Actinomycetota bacterium]|nr:ribosome maturation factor RimP [Actinomycetota bacterium]
MTTSSRDGLVARLTDELTAPLAALGLDLEDVDVTAAGKRRMLRVAVDKDGGVTLEDVADGTREVSRILDETDAMGNQPYTLEVGSPGIDRPLTLPRHWRRNADRLVKVTLADGSTLTGRITGNVEDWDDDTATLMVDGDEHTVPIRDVAKARVQIEFKRKED